MEEETKLLKKEKKTMAIVMAVAGLMIWFFIDSGSSIVQSLLKGLGILLFIYGLFSTKKRPKWSELSFYQKMIKVVLIAILVLLFLIIFLADQI